MIPHDMVMRMFETFGPERFLFGTDFPMWSPGGDGTAVFDV